MDLHTQAEKHADAARHLPAFSGLSLPDVRKNVAEMLRLIGQVEGIFSTYTKHDISHIDKMLRMLDWLIPERTARAMTPIDWLTIVLAIYLHDLGMLVTAEEFRDREKNPSFTAWLRGLSESSDGREFIDRTSRMSEPERDRFFFQEYIRKGHAARVREWITGRHSHKWSSQVGPIALAIGELLKPLPSRFRDYLGNVCESHHQDDLENRTKYPLYAVVGDVHETVNVQYAAVLLRTADLLHITKDRTPSVAYQTVGFSDPMGVSEWDKQRGVFAVHRKKRLFCKACG